MVFEDESSEDTSSLPYMHSTSSTDGLNQVIFLELGLWLGFQIWGFLIWLISVGFDLGILIVRVSAGPFQR